ncbi:MurR/RpiR family transcriptional regulator [Mollicutes bacterium LVI A0078]|nr:MurR/RpiR family transcriptional regulator [Mollicutes bacterium LVI A0075]WOO91399.1 MurR/RpiR family transcriptional regulator [Mollicutes bacterium LVI A0078]
MYKVLHLFDNSNITNEFSRGEFTVYSYIRENMETISEVSSEELAEITFTSPATINRTCKKLGTLGFSHLKHALIDDLNLRNKNVNSNRTVADTTNLIAKVNFEQSSLLANAIKESEVLFVYSAGASNIAALYLERQLLNIGIKCIDVEQQKMLENFSGENLLIISSSGETERILDLVNNLKDKHNILAITASGSKLDKISNVSFTHNILIDKLDPLTREQQIHMLVMINDVVSKI